MLLLVFSKIDPFSDRVYREIAQDLKTVRELETATLYRYRDTVLVLYERQLDLPFTDYVNRLAQELGIELVVYISRHEMKNPRPLITAHTPGNWENAEYGGKPEHVSISPAHVQSELIRALHRYAQELNLVGEYEVTLEATHHGPSLDHPAVFIEVGSTEKEWSDNRCIKLFRNIIGNIEDIVNRALKSTNKVVLSIGDLHYSTITSHVISNEYDVGHIIPKYVNISEKILLMSVNRTTPRPSEAIVHWKSIRKEIRELVTNVLSKLGLSIVKRK